MKIISIPKIKIRKEGGVVVLSVKEYERLRSAAIPTYYLSSKAALRLDDRVKEALRDHKMKKTKRISSLRDLKP